MENSGNLKESRENPEVLHFYGAPGARAVFKFVVGNETDLQEVTEFVTKYQIPKAKVFLMPEGILRDDILDKSEWIIEKCKELGYRFSTRLHVLIWNNKRKV
jgi:organic radical activating enzyme